MARTATEIQVKQEQKKIERSNNFGSSPNKSNSILALITCIAGIYLSFLTWAVLQERISTTSYGPDNLIFRNPLVINTVQSLCASIVGYLYTIYSQDGNHDGLVFSNKVVISQYFLIALTSSLASPFGYASLKHIDYLTLLLGKSCKLLPVMILHVTIFRKKYPVYKYMMVFAVTLGVSLFTLYHPVSAHKTSSSQQSSSLYGLFLLVINLLFDGLTNATQDHIFHTQPSVNGPKMMCGINLISTILTSLFLLTPFTNQLFDSIEFFKLHPNVLTDIILFSLCGAIGQVFIFYTLSRFGSLALVTITVTRKMMSMLLSVVWFHHRLSPGQWLGVFLVFGGVGAEAMLKYVEKKRTTSQNKLE
ncbi:UAA transporter [Lipomyces japonicus]|uniref:UAA transporter n=1 Tax=Lipomyces japonicus TaxID=56871 RepID=UPI0034CF9D05